MQYSQLCGLSYNYRFRPVHDADPTASLPKIEADLLVIQLYSEGKPRYVLVNGSQLSPGMDAFIAALLEVAYVRWFAYTLLIGRWKDQVECTVPSGCLHGSRS